MELLALDRLQPAAAFAQQQDLLGIIDVLDQVVDASLVIERVMELELPLAAGLVDQGDGLRLDFFSQTSVSGAIRGGSATTS